MTVDLVTEFDLSPGGHATTSGGEADKPFESDAPRGLPATTSGGEAEGGGDVVMTDGLPSRYINLETEVLGHIAATYKDFQQIRLASLQRGLSPKMVKEFELAEKRIGGELRRALRAHPLWPWLSQFRGLGGVYTAILISRIGDPRRFPGQRCTEGHTWAVHPTEIVKKVGPCPFTDREGNHCPGERTGPRRGTGTRSLWHYLGLHVVDGRSPRKRKGVKADWDPLGRTAVLMPMGIATAIVMNNVPVYRDIYDAQKERLIRERGADVRPVREDHTGSASLEGTEADLTAESDEMSGLRPFESDAIARKIAAKAFVADLLHEWKRLVGADRCAESEMQDGPDQSVAA